MELGDTYSMRIWLKPERMAQYGLVPSDITGVLGEQNIEAPTGSLGESSQNVFQFTMKYRGRLKSVEEFQNTVVRSREDGSILRLKDVADVELGTMTYSFRSEMDSKPAVLFMMFQTAGSNATAVNKQITAQIDEMRKSLPEGTEFVTMMSSNDFLFASIHNVVETLVIAIILVILVVYFFLQDFKSTLIPSISIIVSLVGTFACLVAAGFSLNILTLFALVLAIGTVVDDARPMNSLTGFLPFSYLVEAKDISPDTIYHVRPTLEQISSIMLGSDEVEIKAVVNLSIIAFAKKQCKAITDMSISDIDYEKMNQLAGIIGYMVQEEDTLWNIAKRFYTSIDTIRKVNQLERDELVVGQKLVIVKG